MKKEFLGVMMAGVLASSVLAGCGNHNAQAAGKSSVAETKEETKGETKAPVKADKEKKPKYVFLFVGDGMSYPQIQLTNYFVSANESKKDGKQINVEGENKNILESKNQLTMMEFPVAGSAQTYDSTSFAPDSASTATSLATGYKTWSGSINVSLDFSEKYETIAEKLKEQKDYKIGIVSSVNINHATPAAFYAHQPSRNSYYEIGLEMIESDFDYFAGGALLSPKGKDETEQDLYEIAEKEGYRVVKTQAEAEKLTEKDGKAIVIDEHLADSDAMAYDMDLEDGQWALADYVEKGIEMLDNEKGFFMMVEGGKIDWACHANDAAATISDTIALDKAVEKAVDFYEQHPDETLIIVTGDHETGGLTIGYAGTDYDTFLTNFNNQKISYAKFDSDYVTKYKENKTDFADVMKDVTELFGLKAPEDAKEQSRKEG